MKEKSEFGFTSEDPVWDEYKDGYVIIVHKQGDSASGKFRRIEEGYVILNPFDDVRYDKEKGILRKFIEKNKKINASGVESITPTTRKNLKIFQYWSNIDSEVQYAKIKKNMKT